MSDLAPEDGPVAVGIVVEEDRGSLPFALVHGEPLVACAAWALGEAGVQALDLGTPWAEVVAAERPLVLHDALCPMAPSAFLAECVEQALASGRIVVAVRPVSDTLKVVRDGVVGETLDRDTVHAVASPVVLPVAVVAALDALPGTDLAALVGLLAERFDVETALAPAQARRVASVDDVRVLEALTAPSSPRDERR